jgi:hypothetical protein
VRGGAFCRPRVENRDRNAALVQGKGGAETNDPTPDDDN